MDNVRFVASTDTAFAAVKMDGTIRVWGDPKSGGSFCTLRGVQARSWGHGSQEMHLNMEVHTFRSLIFKRIETF